MGAFFKSFTHAARGVLTAVCSERNLRFHLCAAFYVYLFSFFYNFSLLQYALITILVGGVLALELVNTALERLTDLAQPRFSAQAGLVKDLAAGAVLIFSVAAAVCGILLYWNHEAFLRMGRFFQRQPLWLLVLLLSLGGSFCFVFLPGRKRDKP